MKGGHQLYVSLQQELVDTIKWVQQHKSQLERERQIRAQDPAAQELFTQYETYLNLTYNK
jgi:carbohydrate-selective porin OprB